MCLQIPCTGEQHPTGNVSGSFSCPIWRWKERITDL